MVAKSFQNFTQIDQPFAANGKMYVTVKNEKTGTVRKVRWYTEYEYAKLYPEDAAKSNVKISTQKEALGFQKGYITIFKGDTYGNLEWFKKSIARYCKFWGWYIVSTEEIPADLPQSVTPITLNWDTVGDETGALKSESAVKSAVESLIYSENDSTSEWVGTIGERLELNVTITAAIELDGAYGASTLHTMEDECGNVYVWTTSAKHWEVGSVKHIKGTLKDHKTYHCVKQNVLTRCIEINK